MKGFYRVIFRLFSCFDNIFLDVFFHVVNLESTFPHSIELIS